LFETDFTFPHDYEVAEIGDLPGTGKFQHPVVFFPPSKDGREPTGLWLKVSAAGGKTWIGVFAFGYPSPPAFCRIVSSPNPNRVCVISNGAGYFVSADEPDTWEEVPLIPILDVRPIPEHGLLVFSDFTGLAAYDSNGLRWRSPQVCHDGLKILNVNDQKIEGIGYNPTNSSSPERPFAIDLKTGALLLPAPISTDGKSLW
jgi:hypothetical protein